jgi:hypothetical protein
VFPTGVFVKDVTPAVDEKLRCYGGESNRVYLQDVEHPVRRFHNNYEHFPKFRFNNFLSESRVLKTSQ